MPRSLLGDDYDRTRPLDAYREGLQNLVDAASHEAAIALMLGGTPDGKAVFAQIYPAVAGRIWEAVRTVNAEIDNARDVMSEHRSTLSLLRFCSE